MRLTFRGRPKSLHSGAVRKPEQRARIEANLHFHRSATGVLDREEFRLCPGEWQQVLCPRNKQRLSVTKAGPSRARASMRCARLLQGCLGTHRLACRTSKKLQSVNRRSSKHAGPTVTQATG